MNRAPRRLRRTDRTLIVRTPLSTGHDCEGELVILRPLSSRLAEVLCADRCALDPRSACDGVATFKPGDVVRLPAGWRLYPDESLQVDDLKLAGPRRSVG